jgi:hypothetical protein
MNATGDRARELGPAITLLAQALIRTAISYDAPWDSASRASRPFRSTRRSSTSANDWSGSRIHLACQEMAGQAEDLTPLTA